LKKIILNLILSFGLATDYYVSTTGHLQNNGSFNQPFLEIQQCADINDDTTVNVLDAIQLINIILN